MTDLSCYKLKEEFALSTEDGEFDRYIAMNATTDVPYGPISRDTFDAKLFVRTGFAAPPRWTGFVNQPFGGPTWGNSRTTSAALIVKIGSNSPSYFAFTFGSAGRYMLHPNAYDRAFGLRTALNLLSNPDTTPEDDPPEIRAVTVSRIQRNKRRSEQQLARGASLDEFELDTLSDIFNAATGVPVDTDRWGTSVSGREALYLNPVIEFDELGPLCEGLDDASQRTDYQTHFAWVDYFQPVSDPDTKGILTELVLDAFKAEQWEKLDIAPPEMVDWERFGGFHYHFDRKPPNASRVVHRELRIEDYFTGVRHEIDQVDFNYLDRRPIDILDGNDMVVGRWPAWRWLSGIFEFEDTIYVLDSGSFYAVDTDYLNALNTEIDQIPDSTFTLPPAKHGETEPAYTSRVVAQVEPCLHLDQKLIYRGGGESGVELCDLLSREKHLIHLKRGFDGEGLSHLISQATGSAELLHRDRQFRERAAARIKEYDSDGDYAYFSDAQVDTAAFEVVFGIIGKWNERPASSAIPFLSRVNLRNATRRLFNSRYKYSIAKIPVGAPEAGDE